MRTRARKNKVACSSLKAWGRLETSHQHKHDAPQLGPQARSARASESLYVIRRGWAYCGLINFMASCLMKRPLPPPYLQLPHSCIFVALVRDVCIIFPGLRAVIDRTGFFVFVFALSCGVVHSSLVPVP